MAESVKPRLATCLDLLLDSNTLVAAILRNEEAQQVLAGSKPSNVERLAVVSMSGTWRPWSFPCHGTDATKIELETSDEDEIQRGLSSHCQVVSHRLNIRSRIPRSTRSLAVPVCRISFGAMCRRFPKETPLGRRG